MSRKVATMKDDIVVDRSPIVDQYLPPAPAKPSSAFSASSAPGSQAGDSTDSTLNRKQTLIKSNIELRKRFESMVLKWQEILCDPVTEDVLGEAANRIKQSHYVEVIEERNIVKLCGYPLCSRPPRDIKGKFRISLHERKVFDISLLKQFCSSTCLAASRWLQSQLTEEPLYFQNSDPEYLKTTRVSIVPLDMELAEFQQTRAKTGVAAQDKVAPAFILPTHNLDSGSASKTASGTTTAQGPSLPTPASASSSLSSAYVQSIFASVPETPSHIKIVEHEPLNTSNMDQVMSDVFGADHNSPEHDHVEGFRVPIDHKDAGSNVGSDTNVIEQKMAQVTLSDSQQRRLEQQQQHEQGDHSMRRSGSSMSMDTQP
ncbi:RNA polymerase II associated protein 2 [Mortierella alpina]|uniref:RNA polymerase II subunit B1 CTD phosphatase RPAP2 homolog n=1 Tax=Mortierella alpina TaxID=64518 RepID=A0A9P6JJB0_MORAP|nr:RNA polymerase II associated protein 2 [Mortierella alpina]